MCIRDRLTLIHYTIYPILSFSPGDGGIIPIPTISDAQTAYKNEIVPYDKGTNFKNMNSCFYTVAMDLFLYGNFQSIKTPRAILYKATAPANPSSDSSESALSIYGNATNILVWLDPVKNDLSVSAILIKNGSKHLSTSPPIENLPIRKPIRLAVVFTQSFIEVYIDGKLRLTHVLTDLPIEITKGQFYGPILAAKNSVAVSNLQYWSYPLSPRQIQANGAPIAKDTLFTTPER